MSETKAQKRIEGKNRKRRSQKPKEEASEAAEAPESDPEPEKAVPTGPEPTGIKERVKRGFLTERDALDLLAKGPSAPHPRIVGWLRRRL